MEPNISLREARAVEEEISRAFRASDDDQVNAQLVAFVLGAKPAVFCDSRQALSLDAVIAGCKRLPFRHHVSLTSDGEILIANTEAVEARVHQLPDLARLVGWRTTESTEENLDRIVEMTDNTGAFGFVLGFPQRSILDFRRNKTSRFPKIVPRQLRFLLRSFADRVAAAYLRRRFVEVTDPDGNVVCAWVAYGDPDPEEQIIRDRVRDVYSRAATQR